MLWLYAFCAVPFLMLGVICLAIVGKVREGRYRKHLLGEAPRDTPQPAVAVALVMSPFPAIILVALGTRQIGWLAVGALTAFTIGLGFLVYSAAAKRGAGTPNEHS